MHALRGALLVDGVGCRVAAIAPDHVELVDAPQLDALHNLLHVRATPRGAKDGAAPQLDAVHNIRSEVDRLRGAVIEAAQAILDAKYLVGRDTVVGKSVHNVLYHIVQARAQSTTCHNRCCNLLRLEVDASSRSGADCIIWQRHAYLLITVVDAALAAAATGVGPFEHHGVQEAQVLVTHEASPGIIGWQERTVPPLQAVAERFELQHILI
mmetsp:Transcript_1814/g.5277  ORF Transcript_1814/g.5277 Transcript_1814/m.5277 type:complete len:211 (-) Transcript_1814:335-967(-)